METTTNRLSSAKWSRNLNKDCQSEANRLRLLERQRQLIESKLQRRQHQNANIVAGGSASGSSSSTTTSRPATSIGNLRSAVQRQKSSTDLSIDDQILDDEETTIVNTKDFHTNRARTSIPGTRTMISSLDSPPAMKQTERRMPNSISNNNMSNEPKDVQQMKPSTANRNFRDSRSMSKSEANLNSALANDMNITNGNRKLPISPNPLTTVLTDEELLKFVSQPVSPDVTLQCTIIRDKKGLDRSLYPTYYMHLQDIVANNLNTKSPDMDARNSRTSNNDKIEGTATVWMSDSLESINSNDENEDVILDEPQKATFDHSQSHLDNNNRSNSIGGSSVTSSSKKVFVLSGRRRKKSKTYLIGNNAFDISRDKCIAKLKSNVLGTQFTAIRLHPSGVRYEISSVTYETNVLGFKGPRKMTIIIPKPDEKTNALCNLSLQEELKRNSRAILLLKNKTPIWNEETQSYVLNFHGRVTQASVKNFQLVVQENLLHHNSKNRTINDSMINDNLRRSASSHQLNNQQHQSYDSDDDEDSDDDDDDNFNAQQQYNTTKRNTATNQSSTTTITSNSSHQKLQNTKNLSKSGYLTASSSEDAKQIADTNELVSLQFGRVSNTHFSCDVSWPLSLLQAFAIALSSFDSKLACE